MNKSLDITKLEEGLLTDLSENESTSWARSALNVLRNSRVMQVLCALFILQIVVAGVMAFQSNRSAEFSAGESVFALNADTLVKIEISDGNNNIVLNKQGEKWLIAGDVELPLQDSRIQTLIDSLSTMKTGLPVANSIAAREQLEVADNQFQRRVTISSIDSDPTTLLVGTSPGLRKSHVRREGSDDIYSAGLSVSDMPSSVNQWLDKGLLAVAGIQSLSTGDTSFALTGEAESKVWTLEKPADDERQVEFEKIESAVQALQSLQVTGVASEPLSNEAQTTRFTLVVDAGERVFTLSQDNQIYAIQRDDNPGVFTITESVFEKMLPLGDPDSLLTDREEAAEPEAKESATVETEVIPETDTIQLGPVQSEAIESVELKGSEPAEAESAKE